MTEFELLASRERFVYLTDAMTELQRTKGSEVHGWDNLFAGAAMQQQQQEQPQDNAEPPQLK